MDIRNLLVKRKPADQAIRDVVTCIEENGRYLVEALAGSGKTSICIDFIRLNGLATPEKSITYISYTNAAVKEAAGRIKAVSHLNPNHKICTFNKFVLDVLKFNNILLPDIADCVARAENTGIMTFDHRLSTYAKYEKLMESMPKAFETKPSSLDRFFEKPFQNEHSTTFDFHLVMLYYLILSKRIVVSGYALIVDECQDMTPFKIKLIGVLKYDILIMVGDPKQAIYSHDGCVNFFKLPVAKEFTHLKLTTTFRFSQEACDMIYAPNTVKSCAFDKTTVTFTDDIPQSGVLLVPTNNAIAHYVLSFPNVAITTKRINILNSRFKKWERFNRDLLTWYNNKHGRYCKIEDISARTAYAQYLEQIGDQSFVYASMNWKYVPQIMLKVRLGIVKAVACRSHARGNLLIETIHAFKGSESDVIILTDDTLPHNLHMKTAYDRHCLYYVALTRARKHLILPTAWKTQFLTPFDGVIE